jgi:ABC-type branched-subunit amino acid transport system substrate-binding protein
MKKKIIVGIAVIVVILVALVYSPNEKVDGKIKVGVIAPMAGQYGALGESIRDSISMSLEKDKNIEVIFEDDSFDPKKAVSAYQKLTAVDKVDILINVDSPSLDAIKDLVEKDNIVTFHLTESNFKKDDNVFQIIPFSYPIFTAIGQESAKRYDRVAVVYGAGVDIFETDAEYFKKGLGPDKVTADFKISPNSDMRTEVTKILAFNPDAMTVIVDKDTGIKLLKTLKEQKGTRNVSIICDANIEFVSGDYIKALGSEMFEGCISANLPQKTAQSFKDEFKGKYKYDPLFISDYAYDAAEMIKKLAGTPEKNWRSEIKNMNHEGVSGKMALDEMGTRLAEHELHIFKDGKFVKLEE